MESQPPVVRRLMQDAMEAEERYGVDACEEYARAARAAHVRAAQSRAASIERRVERRCTSCGTLTLAPGQCAACDRRDADREAWYEREDGWSR